MNKPLSAVDLLDQIRKMLVNLREQLNEDLLAKLAAVQFSDEENHITMPSCIAYAAKIEAYNDFLDALRNAYKHVDLQDWGHDNELV